MRILLVEDNPTITFYNQDVVEDLAIFDNIDTCINGKEAINYFEAVKENGRDMPDFMLLDVKMPDYDGFEVVDEIEELDVDNIENCKIFMLTTSAHNRDLEAYKKNRLCLEYLQKPLDSEVLKNLVTKYR